jgi:ABC-type glycerol-3-phosphate transport system permease component
MPSPTIRSSSSAVAASKVSLWAFLPKAIATVIAIVIALIWIGPFLLMVATSIKPNAEFLRGPFALPVAPNLDAYRKVWSGLDFPTLLGNSFLYSATGAALAVLLGVVPAYGLSRFDIPGKKLIFGILLMGLMLPQQTVLIPLYTILRTLHLLDTKIGLILVHGVYGMPMQILALRGFMTSIPKEIDKAAFIEGATDFQVFWKIILPLSIPGILVSYTLNFIAIWKEFVFSLVFLNSESNFPVTVGMLKLNSDRYMSAFNLPSAGLVISQIPIIILFLLLYRKFAAGKLTGAVKG